MDFDIITTAMRAKLIEFLDIDGLKLIDTQVGEVEPTAGKAIYLRDAGADYQSIDGLSYEETQTIHADTYVKNPKGAKAAAVLAREIVKAMVAILTNHKLGYDELRAFYPQNTVLYEHGTDWVTYRTTWGTKFDVAHDWPNSD
jgi:hypothetical protein